MDANFPSEKDKFFEYEEQVERHPYEIKGWLSYIDTIRANDPMRKDLHIMYHVYERSLQSLPRSYKLWRMYLKDMFIELRAQRIDSSKMETLVQLYERALAQLTKMPRLWIDYIEFLQYIKRVTHTRHVLDRALQALPLTQHARIWTLYLSFVRDVGIERLGIHAYRRYLMLEPSKREDFVEYLIDIKSYGQAILQIIQVLNQKLEYPPQKNTVHALYMRLADLISQHPEHVDQVDVDAEAVLRSGMAQFTDEVGKLYCSLATYHIRLGAFESARNVYEEGIESVVTVRDFSMIYDAYVQFLEAMISAEMRAMEQENQVNRSKNVRSDVDRLLQIFEQVADRRPLLLNSVLLRQNPHNVREWEKRIAFYAATDISKAIQTYAEAIKTIHPRKSAGKLHTLWIQFAKYYEQHKDIRNARIVFRKATEVAFRCDEELANIHMEWAEMEIRLECFEEALEIVRSACAVPVSLTVDLRKKVNMTAHHKLHRNVRLWNLRLDLEESLGTYASTREAYDKAFELQIITPQMIIQYAAYMEERCYFEESFRIYERGLSLFPKFPHSRDLWLSYLTKFVDRYKGKKLERARDLFEQAVKAIPDDSVREFYLKYIALEEAHGMLRNVILLFERATDAIARSCSKSAGQEQLEMYELYVKKAQKYFGVGRVRQIYQKGLEKLDDQFVVPICLKFAALEAKLGEIDRARAIYSHGSQFADPRTSEETFWKIWHDFEVAHGSEVSYLEMLRIKRSVVARYASVNYHMADMVPATLDPKVQQEKERNLVTNATSTVQNSGTMHDPMANLESQLMVNDGEDKVMQRKRTRASSDVHESDKKVKVAVVNEEEIDLDEEESAMDDLDVEKREMPEFLQERRKNKG